MEKDLSIQAQHLPGRLDEMADEESRVMKERSDWILCPRIFQSINHKLGPLEVELFAS